MSFFRQLLIFILISIIFYYNDIVSIPTTKCLNNLTVQKQNKVYGLLFIHHFISVIAHFGWLSTSRPLLYFYVSFNFIIFVHWLTNKDKCIVTETINKYCNFPKDRLFPDAFEVLGFKKYPQWNNKLHHVYIILGTIIGIIKLYFHTNIF